MKWKAVLVHNDRLHRYAVVDTLGIGKGKRIICKHIRTETEAMLIAAAPELLEALESFEEIVDIWLPLTAKAEHADEMAALHNVRNKALAAIAKAKG